MTDEEREDSGYSDGTGDDDHSERVNRELIELLNELRVALPGVQVLFAFLLAVPFANGWTSTTEFQKDLYFGVLSCTAISSALLIAPSAYHRINFRHRDKERLLLTSNALTIAGLAFLAAAIVGAITLIADFVFGSTLAWITAGIGLILFVALWFALPVLRRDPSDTPANK